MPPASQPSSPDTMATSAALGSVAAPDLIAAVAPAMVAASAGVLTAGAVAQITQTLLDALRLFARKRFASSQVFMFEAVRQTYPTFDTSLLHNLLDREAQYEEEFLRRQLDRVNADLPGILAITDPGQRQARLQAMWDREKRYSLQRDGAMLDRALGEVDVVLLKALSPEGAYWKLSDRVQEHTPDCLAMGEKVWPWAVLDEFHPPRHYGCPCSLFSVDEAVQSGWMTHDQVPDHDDALRRFKWIQDNLEGLEEADVVALAEAQPRDRLGRWIAYHVAPESARADIRAHGLRPSKETMMGVSDDKPRVYLHPNAHSAGEHHGWSTSSPHDIWRVNTEGLKLDETGSWPVSFDPIPPERLTLVVGKEHPSTWRDDRSEWDTRKDLEEVSRWEVGAALGVLAAVHDMDGDITHNPLRAKADLAVAPITGKAPLRWAAGTEHGGEFRPKVGGNPGARLVKLVENPPKSPLAKRGSRRARWGWVGGTYMRIPEADRFERPLGRHVYHSPPGSTILYRDGKPVSGPGMPAPMAERVLPVPQRPAPPRSLGNLEEQADQIRREFRSRAYRHDGAVKIGDGPQALLGALDNGYVMENATPKAGGVTDFVLRKGDDRLQVSFDGNTITAARGLGSTGTGVRQKSDGPPRNFRAFSQDVMAWADELGARFSASVNVPDVKVDSALSDHAGTHQWSGEVELGRDTKPDMDSAGRARANGERLTDRQARGVWSSYWVAAHEAGHGVNPIDPLDFHGGNANLEEALAEEVSHVLAAERLAETGQDDVLAWRKANPDAIAVRGVYRNLRHALKGLIDRAEPYDAQDSSEFKRRELLLDLKFKTHPAERFAKLGELIAKRDSSRSAADWAAYAETVLTDPDTDPDTGTRWGGRKEGVLQRQDGSPGQRQVGKFNYGRFRGHISDDGLTVTSPDGEVRRIETMPLDHPEVAALSDGTAIVHYKPGQEFTEGLYYADGTPKSFRYVDTLARAKMTLRAFNGKGSPGWLDRVLGREGEPGKPQKVGKLANFDLFKTSPDSATFMYFGKDRRGRAIGEVVRQANDKWHIGSTLHMDPEDEIIPTGSGLHSPGTGDDDLFDDSDLDLDTEEGFMKWMERAAGWIKGTSHFGHEEPQGSQTSFGFGQAAPQSPGKGKGKRGKGKGKGRAPGKGGGQGQQKWVNPVFVKHPLPPDKTIGGDGERVTGPIPQYDDVRLTIKDRPGAGFKQGIDAEGRSWFVNEHEGDQDRVASQVLASAIYRKLGVSASRDGTISVPIPDFSLIPDVELDEKPIGKMPIEKPKPAPSPSGKSKAYQPGGNWGNDSWSWADREASGIIILDPNGTLWIYEPRNHFGGYAHTFPKGGVEPGLTPQQNAHKELWEETGLHARIFDVLGDFKGDTSTTRYYIGARTGGEPTAGAETFAVKNVTFEEAAKLLNKSRDKEILAALMQAKPSRTKVRAVQKLGDDFPLLVDNKVVAKPAVPGVATVPKDAGPAFEAGFMADALLGQRESAAMWSPDGIPTRIKVGQTLGYGTSASKTRGPFSPIPSEVWTLTGPKAANYKVRDIPEDERRDMARDLATKLPVDDLNALVDAAPYKSEDEREKTRAALIARLEWISDFGEGKVDPPGPLSGDLARDELFATQSKATTIKSEQDALKVFSAAPAAFTQSLRTVEAKDASADMKAAVSGLDSLMGFLRPTDDDAVVYAGLNLAPDRAAADDLGGLLGQTFEERSFLPTNFDDVAARQYPAVLRIMLPTGSKAAYLPALTDVPPDDPEVILPRRQKFKITKRSEVDGKVYVDAVALPPPVRQGSYTPYKPKSYTPPKAYTSPSYKPKTTPAGGGPDLSSWTAVGTSGHVWRKNNFRVEQFDGEFEVYRDNKFVASFLTKEEAFGFADKAPKKNPDKA